MKDTHFETGENLKYRLTDMVAFGNFLLSDTRKVSPTNRKNVTDADIANFLTQNGGRIMRDGFVVGYTPPVKMLKK